MSSLLLSQDEQGIVIFHFWKSLPYKTRLTVSLISILLGFVFQYMAFQLLPGILLVLAGNLLLLVKGYDKRIKLDKYHPESEWVSTDAEQLQKIVDLNKSIKKWDVSAFDITSGLGVLMFILSLVVLVLLFAMNPFSSEKGILILVANLSVLIYPHWFTGVKRITTLPALISKINLYLKLMEGFQAELALDKVNYLTLVNGKDQKLPADLKMKIKFKDQPEDFLGLYAQVSMNNVQGQDYPYFYAVLVAKDSTKRLSNCYDSVSVPENVIKEFSHENDVEIIIIRQYTTKKSGYHTDSKAQQLIFGTGLETARQILGNSN